MKSDANWAIGCYGCEIRNSQLGIGVGISSGANFLGALMLQNKLGKDAVVVTVFPDTNKKYLSTDLIKEESVKEDFISTDVELISFKSLNRICRVCDASQ